MTPEDAWTLAVQIVGTKSQMAREIGVTPQRIHNWDVCPAEFVLKAEAAVHTAQKRKRRRVTRFDLRPDLYPKVRKSTKGE